MYESDGTPVVAGTSLNLYANSLIGSQSNTNLTDTCKTSLANLYGPEWAKGLVTVGSIGVLFDEGLVFYSNNGFSYYVSGKDTNTETGMATMSNVVYAPTMEQQEAVSDYEAGPLPAPAGGSGS